MAMAGLSLLDKPAIVEKPLLRPENSGLELQTSSSRHFLAAPAARAVAGAVRPPMTRYSPPATTIPNSQLKSAPLKYPEIGPCSAGTSPSWNDQPATRPARNEMMPPQFMSP